MKKSILYSIIGSTLFCLPLFFCKLYSTGIWEFFYLLMFGLIFLLTAICAFIALVVIITNFFRKQKHGEFAISINVIFLTMVFIYLIYIAIPQLRLPSGSNLMKFNSSVWKTEDSQSWKEDGISVREKMSGDLLFNVLPGKTKTEIEELLGTSLETNNFKSIAKNLIYYLGPERDSFFAIDSEWLLIWIDDNNKFKKYKIVND